MLSFIVDGQRLQFPCDTFSWWQDNLYAIAKALEALRMVERYGVSKTSQYAGFKALPSQTGATMTTDAAVAVIIAGTLYTEREVLNDAGIAKAAVRAAVHRTHPDRNNGQRIEYDRVDAARRVLSSHHGVSL
ncbi:MAG: molecular chaperone DnaJ [Gemmatimonadaceae bacterium]|nr:molecular chaperone DnaJ [Gemmatimonadaceae bacterium]